MISNFDNPFLKIREINKSPILYWFVYEWFSSGGMAFAFLLASGKKNILNNTIPMNATHFHDSSLFPFLNPFQLFIQELSDSVAQLLSYPRRRKGIPSLLRMLKRHGQLQFELLEERSYSASGHVLRKVGVEPSYLALSRERSCTIFDAYQSLAGTWMKGTSGLELQFQADEVQSVNQKNLHATHIQAYVNQYLIVNCRTGKGVLQRIYTLSQKGA